MGTPLSPAYKRAADLLADGNWHPIDDVITAAMAAVPPGQAYRRGETIRLRVRTDAGPRTRGDRQTSITTGARAIARAAIDGMVRHGTAERDGDQIRRRP